MKAQGPARHNWDNIFFIVDAFEVRHLCKGIRCGEKKIVRLHTGSHLGVDELSPGHIANAWCAVCEYLNIG